jgi:glycosyltransferase involved in cell wall biosynthesis
MSRRAKNEKQTGKATKSAGPRSRRRNDVNGAGGLPANYWKACELVRDGHYQKARAAYARLEQSAAKADARVRTLIQNDLAVIAAMEGQLGEACETWRGVLDRDTECLTARLNLGLVEAELSRMAPNVNSAEDRAGVLPGLDGEPTEVSAPPELTDSQQSSGRVRVAVLSFLFNWPSTGGGNMHTAGLVEFLGRDGYDVRHFYARYPAWRTGGVTGSLDASEPIDFDDTAWNADEIQARFRRAVDRFGPDYVVITDSWNMKPILAEAMRDYACLLLFQAHECLCPLNNLRLLADGPNQVRQCPRNQLATPEVCQRCVAERGHHAGSLHQLERDLAGVGTKEYDQKLRRSLEDAEAVLAMNPLIAGLFEPFARRVCVVPLGMDSSRFPWPAPEKPEQAAPPPMMTVFMAAVANEFIKGFHIAHEACRLLRQSRSDFELVVTFDPPGPIDEFTRSVGWCSQDELPRHYQAADICLVPTIAQDGMSLTSIEAMAAGIPVIASRIGGLPYTVIDETTGLLFEPGNPADLAKKIARLLDDPNLRHQMGSAGRKRFEQDFTWEGVIERYWRHLLPARRSHVRAGAEGRG